MSLDYENDGDFNARLIDEVLSQYPDKTAKRRKSTLASRRAERHSSRAPMRFARLG